MTERLAMLLHAISVRRGDRWVLRDISWTLRPGERWALVGDNGAGKTQLLKLLSGDVWPTPGGARAARNAGVRREPRGAQPGGTALNTGGRHYRVGRHPVDLIEAKRRVAYKRVTATLRLCGLSRHAAREFLSLSYGQKRLALLARALVQNPDWLLLDEFYNGLDSDYRLSIDKVLGAAVRRGQSWVATAHRAGDVPRGTRCMLELAEGRMHVIKRIRPSDLARLTERAGETPRHPPRARTSPRAGKSVRAGKLPRARNVAASSAPVLLRLSRVNLHVDYRPVLRDLDWQLRRGEHWAIFGANGAGKSSFLKLLYGDLSPSLGGRIERAGFPRETPIAEWKRYIGYVSPELQTDYAVNVSVFDLVASGRYASIGLLDEATAADRRVATDWLKFFGLVSVAKRRPRELSYGQLRRALIARAMAADARILLLDEPLTGLDPAQRAIMKRLLERLMNRLTLIVAVHHAEDLPRGMTHGLRLHNRCAHPSDPYSAT